MISQLLIALCIVVLFLFHHHHLSVLRSIMQDHQREKDDLLRRIDVLTTALAKSKGVDIDLGAPPRVVERSSGWWDAKPVVKIGTE